MSTRHVFVLLPLISLAASLVFAQDKQASPYQLTVRAERESAIYKQGETVVFKVGLLENGKPLTGKRLSYTVQGDGKYEKKGRITSAEEPVGIEASLDRPGFLKCTVSWRESGKTRASALGGAGIDPLEIRSGIAEPEDFDAFWAAKKKALDAVPLNPTLVKVDADKVGDPKVEVFDVKVDCLGGKPVSGYLAKPVDAKPKSLPIVVSYHGAGVRSAVMPVKTASRGALALDINAHGIENGKPASFYKALADGELKGYRTAGGTDRETIYFIGMYLRVLRSLQYMKSLPEWDGKTIAVTGGSQGGAQALVAAALDPDVGFCLAYVPALCYLTGSLEGNFDGWPGFLRNKTLETADPAVVKAVPYVDAANFAKRIKAESVLSVGFIDYTCSPTSVYVAYNNIPAKKKHIIATPETKHNIPPKTREEGNKRFRQFLRRNAAK